MNVFCFHFGVSVKVNLMGKMEKDDTRERENIGRTNEQ